MGDEKKLKHLEMIQGIINRLSTNSFLLKGWTVVLVSGLFALSQQTSNLSFAALAYFPAFMLWGLDGYFLYQERLYRGLYDRVRLLSEEKIDFSMNPKVERENNRLDWGTSLSSWIAACVSKTLLVFHGVLIAAVCTIVAIGTSPGASGGK